MRKDLFILIDFIYDPCAINLSYILASVNSRRQEGVVYAESSTKETRRPFILARA